MIDEVLFDARRENGERPYRWPATTCQPSGPDVPTPVCSRGSSSSTYGTNTPITQLASINVPEARLVVIKPYESISLAPSRPRIRNSDLGLNPVMTAPLIRVAVPQLTEERRRELVKQAKGKGEDAKVSVRNIRRKAMEELHRSARMARPARTRSVARKRSGQDHLAVRHSDRRVGQAQRRRVAGGLSDRSAMSQWQLPMPAQATRPTSRQEGPADCQEEVPGGP